MSLYSKKQSSASFLPADYVQKKAEGRSGIMMMLLFGVVMFGVVGAFLVTNRQWKTVKGLQEEINKSYASEAKKIEQLKVLEAQKAEMLDKADITMALIERVPRSILMAEVINRMPGQLTLVEFELVSKRLAEAPPQAAPKPKPRSLASKGKGAAGKKAEAAPPPPERPKPPKYEYILALEGLSRTDREVADYTAALQGCGLLDRVEFKFSNDVKIEDSVLRKFRIEAMLRPGADARHIEPLHVSRLRNANPDEAQLPIEPPTDSTLRRMGIRAGTRPVPQAPPTDKADEGVVTVPEPTKEDQP